MKQFNVVHSADRVCAEHGIGMLKRWGVIRGRSDVVVTNDVDLNNRIVRVCWGLTNFLQLEKYNVL